MIPYDDLPAVNAALNGLCALLLAIGFVFIRRRNVPAHRRTMKTAFVVSILFLVSYLTYHRHAGVHRYPGVGAARTVYLAILATHTVLAAAVVPLVLRTLWLATRGRFLEHRRIARWTLPIWFYVSVTGVVVYLMLYRPFNKWRGDASSTAAAEFKRSPPASLNSAGAAPAAGPGPGAAGQERRSGRTTLRGTR
ncbi:MAG TPA: DUF420 domain-containing protein [Thermoanaerobaculia bacterium]|nr:DUF420 domain-containing protein [Thermoanaerobaculia bacterium]